MVTVGGQHRTTHLPFLKGIGSLLELRIHLSWAYPYQFTSIGSTATVLRHLLTELCKVCTLFEGLPDRVCALCNFRLLLGCSLGGNTEEDMCRKDKSLLTNLFLRTVVGLTGLCHHLCIRRHRGQYLLVTIGGKLILERRERVEPGIDGCCHLHLINGIKVGILLDIFLVDHAVAIVLVE